MNYGDSDGDYYSRTAEPEKQDPELDSLAMTPEASGHVVDVFDLDYANINGLGEVFPFSDVAVLEVR